jgi:hypothetical protein
MPLAARVLIAGFEIEQITVGAPVELPLGGLHRSVTKACESLLYH